MKLSLPPDALAKYVERQFESLFPDGEGLGELPSFVSDALQRVEYCFARIGIKGFSDADGARFYHRHSDQYTVFLYYLANSAFQRKPGHPVADKAYALNKALHGCDLYYEVGLPAIFALQHPVGTVLGRATYSDYFLCYHNCTVGANLADDYPSFGRGVVMYGGSRMIGRTKVGDNSLVSTGTIVIDGGDLPANSVVHGLHPNARTSPTKRNVVREIFCAKE
jgi:serine O-acetyltransferase